MENLSSLEVPHADAFSKLAPNSTTWRPKEEQVPSPQGLEPLSSLQREHLFPLRWTYHRLQLLESPAAFSTQ